jgi:hypothetical protein
MSDRIYTMWDGGPLKRLGPLLVKDGISPSLKSANLIWLRMATSDWVGNTC